MPRGRPKKSAPKRKLTPRNKNSVAVVGSPSTGSAALPHALDGESAATATTTGRQAPAVVASDFDIDDDFERRFSITELAEHVGEDRPRVKRLAERHGIVDQHGETTLSAWQAVERKIAIGAKVPLSGPTAPRSTAVAVTAAADAMERKRNADAERAELKAKKEAGALVDRNAARAAGVRILIGARMKLEALPSNVAGQLAGLGVAKIEERLAAEIKRVLADISRIAE